MKISILSLIFTFISLTGKVAFAGTFEKRNEASIVYAGIKEKGIAFDISWADHSGTTEIIIRDKSGFVIYRSSSVETSVKKRFYLAKEDSGEFIITVINERKKIEKRFGISSTFVEQVQVNELK